MSSLFNVLYGGAETNLPETKKEMARLLLKKGYKKPKKYSRSWIHPKYADIDLNVYQAYSFACYPNRLESYVLQEKALRAMMAERLERSNSFIFGNYEPGQTIKLRR